MSREQEHNEKLENECIVREKALRLSDRPEVAWLLAEMDL